jgi:hypothetical protein
LKTAGDRPAPWKGKVVIREDNHTSLGRGVW